MKNAKLFPSAFLLLAFIFFLFGTAIPKDKIDEEIEAIQKKIDEKGYNWTAGRTSVMELSLEERQNLRGLVKPEWYDDWFKGADKLVAAEGAYFPPVFDWRDSAGVTLESHACHPRRTCSPDLAALDPSSASSTPPRACSAARGSRAPA